MATKKTTVTSSSGVTQSVEQPSASLGRTSNRRQAQQILLIWLDSNIDNSNDDCQNTVKQLRQVMNDVSLFTDGEHCVQFIDENTSNEVVMIISGALGQHIVPRVHDKSQVNSIFIFCGNRKRHEEWVKDWFKIKGVYTEIAPICEALERIAKAIEQGVMPITFVGTDNEPSKKYLKLLDPLLMYTEIFKKILFTIQFEEKHFKDFIAYCRVQFTNDNRELENITKFEHDYRDYTSIWWYTYECFLYRMINKGIRQGDCVLIIKMGFFIKDLHDQIAQMHSEQFADYPVGKTFTVYRGQVVSKDEFHRLKDNQGGLKSFNNFLSTSKNRDVPMKFLTDAVSRTDRVGVLFVMTIDPAQATIPFACIDDFSYFKAEEEVLFSMHSIFHIVGIESIDANPRLYRVNLTLTSDNDEDLRQLANQIEAETSPEEEGSFRLGSVLLKMGQPRTAEDIFETLLEQATENSRRASIYHHIGSAKYDQGEHEQAMQLYHKAVEIYKKILPPNHLSLAAPYSKIGMVYDNMGDYFQALTYYEKALSIQEKSPSPNHPDVARSYGAIGTMSKNIGDYQKALSFYEKSLAIQQQSLPSTHPDLASTYNNMGEVYNGMNDYSKALSCLEKALAIREQSLPPDHPDMASSYKNIGSVYENLGEYSKALSCYEKAMAIAKKSLPTNHADLAEYERNISDIEKNLSSVCF